MPRNKYRVSPAEERYFNGRTYASKAEMRYAQTLELLKEAGDVIEYIEQPKFRLGCPENVYVADFLVIRADEPPYVVDVKGMETNKFKRDKKLWMAYGRLPLVIIKKNRSSFVVNERITPKSEADDDLS